MRFDSRFALLLLISWLLQLSVIPYFSFYGIQPDLILIVVATYAFLEGPVAGAVVGFTGGLLEDLLVMKSGGLNVLVKTVIGYWAGLVERTLFGASIFLPMLAMFLVSTISQLSYVAVSFLVGEQIEFWAVFTGVILPSSLYTSLLALPLFPWLCRMLSHEREEKVFR